VRSQVVVDAMGPSGNNRADLEPCSKLGSVMKAVTHLGNFRDHCRSPASKIERLFSDRPIMSGVGCHYRPANHASTNEIHRRTWPSSAMARSDAMYRAFAAAYAADHPPQARGPVPQRRRLRRPRACLQAADMDRSRGAEPNMLWAADSLQTRPSRVVPSSLRITMPAPCYAVTEQEASPSGDPRGAPVEKLLILHHRSYLLR
jgi:hypothetical protein